MADAEDEIENQVKPAVRTVKTAAKRVGAQVKVARAKVADELDDQAEELEERIASLSEEISTLAHQIERFAGHRLDDVREMAADLREAGTVAVRRAGRQTVAAARAVREDPLPTVVALGVVALLATFVMARMNQR